MRIWSVHPKYLDAKGLVALWRETLLAQKVLLGKTKGYRHHPQLNRFKEHPQPVKAISYYLKHIHAEAKNRSYNFKKTKIYDKTNGQDIVINVPRLQLLYEFRYLNQKLRMRDADKYTKNLSVVAVEPHPLFRIVSGGIASWEKVG